MDIKELQELLEKKMLSKAIYVINRMNSCGGFHIEKMRNGKWRVYFGERSIKYNQQVFEHEDEVCGYLLVLLKASIPSMGYRPWIKYDGYAELDENKLKEVLQTNKVPEKCYSLEGGLPEKAYCIEKMRNGKWRTYYSEQGQKKSPHVFEIEYAAYGFLLVLIKKYVKKEYGIDIIE